MLKLTKIQFFKILVLYTLLALAAVCSYNIKHLMTPARKRPFQCNDQSLRKPFVHDTVPPTQLYVLGVYFPMALIAASELISSFIGRKSLRNSSWILKYMMESVIILTLFLTGVAFERLYKSAAKIKLARLRPNFITVCEPVNSDGYICQDLDDTTIMEEYECSSDSYPQWAISAAFTSFPSGHTSLVSYSMVFLICYLYLFSLKLKHTELPTTLVILILQTVCFFMLLFVAISRIFDYRHHWSDVGAGFVCGSSIALILNFYLNSQLENIEKWLNALVVNNNVKDVDSAGSGSINTNMNKNERGETCVIELVAE